MLISSFGAEYRHLKKAWIHLEETWIPFSEMGPAGQEITNPEIDRASLSSPLPPKTTYFSFFF